MKNKFKLQKANQKLRAEHKNMKNTLKTRTKKNKKL